MPCQVDFCQQAPKDIVLVETCNDMPLPQGMMIKSIIALVSAIDTNCFSLLIQNETKREVAILQGTPLGRVQAAELASSIIKGHPTSTTEVDLKLINFSDSPFSEEWKERLRRKLCWSIAFGYPTFCHFGRDLDV